MSDEIGDDDDLPDYARREDNPLDVAGFEELASRQYGWTVLWDGELAGLVAGDMGYEDSGVNLGVLVAHALAKTSGHPSAARQREIDAALSVLVELCRKAVKE